SLVLMLHSIPFLPPLATDHAAGAPICTAGAGMLPKRGAQRLPHEEGVRMFPGVSIGEARSGGVPALRTKGTSARPGPADRVQPTGSSRPGHGATSHPLPA